MSAMTALDATDHGEQRSYLEIADALRQIGSSPAKDLEELWRRMVFNILVSNTDDHLRNHAFLHAGRGWRLSPVYDLNPVPTDVKPRVHALAIDEADASASIETALEVAHQFGLAASRARAIAAEVAAAVAGWRHGCEGARRQCGTDRPHGFRVRARRCPRLGRRNQGVSKGGRRFRQKIRIEAARAQEAASSEQAQIQESRVTTASGHRLASGHIRRFRRRHRVALRIEADWTCPSQPDRTAT